MSYSSIIQHLLQLIKNTLPSTWSTSLLSFRDALKSFNLSKAS